MEGGLKGIFLASYRVEKKLEKKYERFRHFYPCNCDRSVIYPDS